MTRQTVRVEDIAAPSPRSIAIGPFGSNLKAELYTHSGIPVVRGQNIKTSPYLDDEDLVFVSPETAEKLSSSMLNEDDLVFPHRGAIGRVGIVGKQRMLLSSSMMKLTVDPSKADPKYVLYYFRGPGERELLMRASTVGTPGIGQPLTSLRGISIELPELKQQQAIAEVLGALDDKIAANTKLATTADEFLAARLSAHLDAGFDEVRLGDVAGVNTKTVKPTPDGSLRYIDIASVGVGVHGYPELTSWDDAPSRARRRVRKGDTFWSTVRPNRRSHSLNLSEDPLLVGSTGLAVLSPTKVGFAYLYEVTKRQEFTTYLENVAEGSAYPAVRADRFAEAMIPLLSQNDREKFEALAAPIREHTHSLSIENETLAATRDALLPQLMSGKLRVREAEGIVSAAV